MSAKVERYEMRFVPYDEEGRLKRSAPKVGGRSGIEDGAIVMLPLDNRWEEWWELVDPESVPEDVLEKNTKARDAFMIKAKAAEIEREKTLRPATVRII